jgi:hypothetical protein
MEALFQLMIGFIAIAVLALVAVYHVIRLIIGTAFSGAYSQEDGADVISPADRVKRLADIRIEEQLDPIREAEPQKNKTSRLMGLMPG